MQGKRAMLMLALAGLLAAGCESRLQWVKDDGTTREHYDEDLGRCNEAANEATARDVGSPGQDPMTARMIHRALYVSQCMEDKGYHRIR